MARKSKPQEPEDFNATEPQEPEITRVFKERTNKDGTQYIDEQPSISPPAPKETLADADPDALE